MRLDHLLSKEKDEVLEDWLIQSSGEGLLFIFQCTLLKSTLKNRVKAHKRLNNYNDNSKNYGLIAQMVRAHA